MAENPAARFSAALDEIATSREQKEAIEVKSDELWRDSWLHHCDHLEKHLDAIALANPDDKEVQARVAMLKGVIAEMRVNGMPAVTSIADTQART